MIVADASAILAFLFKEKGWRELAKYLIRCISVNHIVEEVTNAIWRATYVKKVLNKEQAVKMLTLFKRMIGINLILVSDVDYLEDAFKLALEYGVSVYDCLYVVLAYRTNSYLLTLDEKQRKIAHDLEVCVLPRRRKILD